MSCCCPHSRSAGRIFSRFARRARRRFERRGFEPSQRRLLAGLERTGFARATLLEVGSGVGHLHQTLLERGARSAVGVDLAPRMTEEACAWAAERGLAGRTHYLTGDFLSLAGEVEPAEVTILDKVICCYPDADALVHASLARTRRVYALTYPRRRWLVRLGVALGAVCLRLIGSDFRAYVHDPEQVESWIRAKGFVKRFEAVTPVWLTQVYVRV
ncbi:MAG: methyltransferase domain-containing protein [Gammaproteobacteria bacterium]|nr:methyltransferase domain-containing protein [Gammaproteobacteria bacterium]NIR97668.1 methyltransferase domain-containing protein [Gammaproteobacteria bacterium]NIT63329.1 methyltransferase domain-containing protein [Gammaproteobacteria bacterium]NIV20247.1 methyltransferase domain-containing protein [Gammaproteobacteria bacterium]NIX10664.1 methyltransferase domain-containing protein [Gammaproteobacteria bacterium]